MLGASRSTLKSLFTLPLTTRVACVSKHSPRANSAHEYEQFQLEVTGRSPSAGGKQNQAARPSKLRILSGASDSNNIAPKKQSILRPSKHSIRVNNDNEPRPTKLLTTVSETKRVFAPKARIMKMEALVEENRQLTARVTELEAYFIRIGVKQDEQTEYRHENQNLRLKVLLQQQKIASLVFTIKQCRGGNRAQLAHFQRRIMEYEPNIERELTDKLAQANRKWTDTNGDLEKIKSLYESSQASAAGSRSELSSSKDVNKLTWENLLETIDRTQKEDERLKLQIGELKNNLEKESAQKQSLLHFRSLYEKAQAKLQSVQIQLKNCKEQLKNTQKELQSLKHNFQQLSFELKGKSSQMGMFEEKLKRNQQTASQLSRMQSENINLKNKLMSMTRDFNDRIFQETSLVRRLSQLQREVGENRVKFLNGIMTAKKNQAKPDMLDENLTFLEHLFSKSQSLYDKIILDYRAEFESLSSQAQNSHKTAQALKATFQKQQKSSLASNQKILGWVDKLVKYITHLSELNCKSCDSGRGYIQQINTIVESMGNFMRDL